MKMSKSKKTKLKKISLLFLATIFAVFLGFRLAKSELPTQEKIKISGVSVNNFLKNSQDVKKRFVTLVKNENFHIFYIPEQEAFVISVTSSPFEEQKSKAEEEFLKILAVDKNSACKLNVDITTPYFANPNEAGKIYKLSFCK